MLVQEWDRDSCTQALYGPYNVTGLCQYSSLDGSVATVNSSGVVSLVGVGSTTANMTYPFAQTTRWDGFDCTTDIMPVSDYCPVTVKPTVSLSCDHAHLALAAGGTSAPDTVATCNASGNPSGGTYMWSANNNNVAILVGGGGAVANATAQQGSSAVNDTAVIVTYTLNQRSVSASAFLTVHKPSSLAWADSFNPSGTTCSVACLANPNSGNCNPSNQSCTYSSYLHTRNYYTFDQFGVQLSALGLARATVEEQLPVFTTCPDGAAQTGSAPSSDFIDRFYLCSRCCLPGGPGCSSSTSPVQTITVNGFPLKTTTVQWTCTGVSVSP